MQLLEMHGRLAYSALFYCVILTIWGLIRVFRRMNLDSSYWSAVLVGETFILVQTALGVILAINGLKDLLRSRKPYRLWFDNRFNASGCLLHHPQQTCSPFHALLCTWFSFLGRHHFEWDQLGWINYLAVNFQHL